MSSQNQQSWVLFTLQFLIFPTLFAKVSAFDRPECLARVTALLKDDNVSLNPAYFWQPNGVSMTDPVLTVAGCKALCRGGSRWYIDIGPRLMTWLLPIVLLIGNLDVSPLDKWRYIEVFHLIGDPMDSSWSFLAKTEAWASCHRLIAQHYPMNSGLGVLLGRKPTLPISTEDIERSPSISSTIDITILSSGLSINELATVVAGIKEVLGPSFNPLHQLLMHVRPGLQPQTKEYNAQIQTLRGAAFKIAERRTDDILRTVFAVVIYLLQILAGFTKVLGGGNSSPPGGRIGTAMLLTWLLPTVIFSNFVGGFASRRDCFEIIKTMIQEVDKQSRQPPDSALQQRLQDKKKFTENQRWSGGSYIYRPQKYVSFGAPSRRRKILIWLLSIAPVLIALVSGSVIMWYVPPGGLSCRGILFIMITLAWLFSACVTWFCSRAQIAKGKQLWTIILIKDILVGMPIMLIVFLSCSGLFNTCFCWAVTFSWGKLGYLPLNVEKEFDYKNGTIYPALVGGCLVLQFATLIAMLIVGGKGRGLMRWSEQDKERVFLEQRSGAVPDLECENMKEK